MRPRQCRLEWPFEWPDVDWIKNGELQRDPGLKFVASWSAKIAEEEMSSPPPLETLSPIPMADGQDSMTVQEGERLRFQTHYI